MKKLYLTSLILIFLLIIFQSCSKQSANDMIAPVSPTVISTTIAPNGNYQLSLAGFDNVAIEKQALHYTVSKTDLDAKTGNMIYIYVPLKDYTGKDEVILSSKTFISSPGGGGCNNHINSISSETGYVISYKTIHLNIAH